MPPNTSPDHWPAQEPEHVYQTPGAYVHDAVGALNGLVAKSPNYVSLNIRGSLDRGAFFALSGGDMLAPPLDLEAMGLPPIPAEYQQDWQPLGIVAQSGSDESIASMRLLAYRPRSRNTMYFSLDPPDLRGGSEAASWTLYGEAVYDPGAKTQEGIDVNPKTDKGVIKVALIAAQPDMPRGQLIRPALTPTERTLEAVDKRDFLRPKIAAALLAGAVAAASLIDVFTGGDDTSKSITSAAEAVRPAAATDVNGVKQAEQNFDEATLSRSRAAFAAYFEGDMNTLQAQMKTEGYTSQWMRAEKLDRVRSSENSKELRAALARILEGLPIELEIGDNDQALQGLSPNYKHKKIENFEAAKRMALGVLNVLNTVDPSLIKESVGKTRCVIVDSLTPLGSAEEAQGYYHRSEVLYPLPPDKEGIVVLSLEGEDWQSKVGHIFGAGWGWTEAAAAHELGHGLDARGPIQFEIKALNPEGYDYVDDYKDTPTSFNGNEVVASAYGNYRDFEDTAEIIGTDILAPHATPYLHESTRYEKDSHIIFQMEQQYPGFTAALLQRSLTKELSLTGKAASIAARTWEASRAPLGAAGVLLMLAALGTGSRTIVVARSYNQWSPRQRA